MTDEEKALLAAQQQQANDPDPEGGNDPNPEGGNEPAPGKTFTQEEVNALIGERLKRDRLKREEELERARLEENNEFKTLYEDAQRKLAEAEASAKQAKLDSEKAAMISAAGYPTDKVELVKRNMHGETPEELKASLDEFMATFPPEPGYTDPSVGNGPHQKPTPKKDSEYGKELFERIRKK